MKPVDLITTARILAILIGSLTLLYQVMEIANGNALNFFLVGDIILGIVLIAAAFTQPVARRPLYLLTAFAYTSGVFMIATFGGLVVGTYDFGAFTTTVGLIPALAMVVLLLRHHFE
ncbi:MAG: hypothetical protein AAF433_21290 [Bacteroidota bacterium]